MGCASAFLILLNFCTLLLGCFLLGISIYLRVQFATGWETIVSLNAVYVGMAAGAIMIIISILGCVVANNVNKQLDCCYLLLVFIVFALTIACAVLANNYKGAMQMVAVTPSYSLTAAPQITLNNGLLSMYTACCSGCTDPSVCNNVNAYYNGTIGANCLGPSNVTITNVCTTVTECPATAVPSTPLSCYVIPAATTNPMLPTDLIDISICTTLASLYSNATTPLVGPAAKGSCGAGDPTTFKVDVNNWFADKWYWISIAMAVICGIEFLIIVSTVIILCHPSRHNKA